MWVLIILFSGWANPVASFEDQELCTVAGQRVEDYLANNKGYWACVRTKREPVSKPKK